MQFFLVALNVVTGEYRHKHVCSLTQELGEVINQAESNGVMGDTCGRKEACDHEVVHVVAELIGNSDDE